MRSIFILISAVIIALLVACGGGNNSGNTNPVETTGPSATSQGATTAAATSSSGAMSAKIDRKVWTATRVTTASFAHGSLTIVGSDGSNPAQTISFEIEASSPGTYQLNQPEEASSFISMTAGTASWQASYVAGKGIINISTLSATGASGSFSLTLIPSPNSSATGTKIVTDGVFNIKFPASGRPSTSKTVAAGGTITAEVNGQAFTGKVVTASFKDRYLTLTASDSQANVIDIEIGAVSGSGAYSLASHNSSSSSAYFKFSAGDTWGTVLPGGTGTAVINSMDSGRVMGTFSFDGPDETGAQAGMIHVINGKFDVTF